MLLIMLLMALVLVVIVEVVVVVEVVVTDDMNDIYFAVNDVIDNIKLYCRRHC